MGGSRPVLQPAARGLALEQFLGSSAGLSPATVTRLTAQWQADHKAFGERDLAGSDYVYVWADGIHLRIRLAEAKSCVLVVMGVRADGTKELIAMADGYRESAESRADLLRDAARRGMMPPTAFTHTGLPTNTAHPASQRTSNTPGQPPPHTPTSPPPSVTTRRRGRHAASAGPGGCRPRHHGEQVEREPGRGERGDLRVVVRRSDLDDIGADRVEVGQAEEDHLQLTGRETARLRCSRAWGVGRVEHVDVDADVHRTVADARPDAVDDIVDPAACDLERRDRREAELLVVDEVLR
ncbi:hypothetical protein SMALB_0121 [Streptomyces malaysiensis]|uniref:Mutator family transposase n=1 Tax=Streptomyces malaysiensis TaxID=92644 RepID=A0A7X5WWF7_STRMQ|nr:hypothetical protein [Streptomyces malaysiensis]